MAGIVIVSFFIITRYCQIEKLLFSSVYEFLEEISLLNSNKTAIILMIFWDFLMFYQIFLPPQVKRSAIISNKHDMYELPQE